MGVIRLFVSEDEGGQVTEYALVLGLVAIAAVAMLVIAGQQLNLWWNSLANCLSQLTNAFGTPVGNAQC